MATDDLAQALATLLAESPVAGLDARVDAASIAAAVSRDSPGAAADWATAFGLDASSFGQAADVGCTYATTATPGLAQLTGDDAARYARHLAALAMASASLGELTISALAEASMLGNAEMLRAGLDVPAVPSLASPSAPILAGPGGPPALSSATASTTTTATDAAPATPAEAVPAKTLEELLAELDALVGLDDVKAEVRHQTQVLRIQALRGAKGLRNPELTRHLVFVGNPGTGKTTVARLVAAIYRAVGLLPKGHLVECDRSALVAGYEGQTAIKAAEVINKALGGALFIDEAYSLAGDEFGTEAIDTLVKAMEDHREELIVIVAGYPLPMQDFISANPGLASRFRLTLTFCDYSDDQLVEIFGGIATAADFAPTEATIEHLRDLLAKTPRDDGFGNARYVRSMFESAVVRQAWRLRDLDSPDVDQLKELLPEDLDDPPAPAPEPAAPAAAAPVAVPAEPKEPIA